MTGWQKLRNQRFSKGQGLLQKEGPLTYDILLQLKFCRDLGAFWKAFRSAYNESHHALDEFSTKANNQTPDTILYGPMYDWP